MKKVAIVTLSWKEYSRFLPDFLLSIRNQDYQGEIKLFVTDNETSPDSFKMLSEIAPGAELVLNKTNDGFAKGMNDGVRQAMLQDFDYIAVTNIHTTLAPSYISELVKVMEGDEQIGVAQGLMLLPDKKTIVGKGNATHFLGFGFCLGYKEKVEEEYPLPTSPLRQGGGDPLPTSPLRQGGGDPLPTSHRGQGGEGEIFYPSGSSMFFRASVLKVIGLLDEEYWMYNEDQEIGWRMWLKGYRCVLAPSALMYNAYEFKRSIKMIYWMDRNRILSILICYKIPTLLLILPAFLVMEVGQWLFAIKNKTIRERLRVYAYFFKISSWSHILRARRRNQSRRKVSDRKMAQRIVGEIKHQEFDDIKLKLVNPVFDLYWKIVRFLIFW